MDKGDEDSIRALVPEAGRDSVRKWDPRYVVGVPNAVGNNITYETLTPEGLVLTEEYARKGHSIKSLCRVLGIHYASFRELRRRNDAVNDAWENGRACLDNEVNDLILNEARKGNLTAAIFYSKGRLGWREVGPAEGESAQAPTVNINISAPLSDEQFAKMITVNAPERKEGDE